MPATTLSTAPDSTDSSLPWRRALFAAAALFCFTPWASSPIALALGAILALTVANPFAAAGRRFSGVLLKTCVILLGFGMDLPVVLRAGLQGAGFAAASIALTLLLGAWLGHLLGLGRKVSALISSGTAICGGSAIAAVGGVIGVAEGEMAVALGTVFILNAVGLYLFPLCGWALEMSQTQFGLWTAIAIHDVSSVVGASSQFGQEALQVATTVKLSRALWIIPVAAAAAWIFRPAPGAATGSKPASASASIPWFIGLFFLASVARSLVPGVAELSPALVNFAKTGMTLTLFLIGAGLSVATLKQVGWKPLVQGVALWIAISVGSLWVIVRWF